MNILPGRKLSIDLFEKSDLSTFLHESGHVFLEVMGDLVESEGASDQLKKDYDTLLKWFKVDSRNKIGVAQHEQFAEGFETYLMSGNAPSVDLQTVFSRFRSWLIAIYKSVANMRIQPTDEIRGVFDRMLATQEELDQLRGTPALAPIIKDAASVGWSQARFEAYLKALGAAEMEEEESLLARTMNDIRRVKTAWWADESAAMSKDVEKELKQQQVYRLLSFLQDGTTPDGDFLAEAGKLDKAPLLARYGQDYLSKHLRYKNVYGKDGIDPDIVADLFGYDSSEEMIAAIVDAPKLEAAVRLEVKRRMVEKHGDVLNDGTIPEMAVKAVHGNKRLGILHTELAALASVAGQQAMTQKQARAAASLIVERTRVRDLNPYAFLRAERKAASEALKAAGKQDWVTALNAKRRQILNAHLYDLSSGAVDDAEKIRTYAKKFSKTALRERLGKVGRLDDVDFLLNRYEFRRLSNALIDKTKVALELRRQLQAGELIGPDAMIASLLNPSSKTNWREATVEELRGLNDMLKQIEKQARDEYKVWVAGETKKIDDIAVEISDHMRSVKPTILPPRGAETEAEQAVRSWSMIVNSWLRPGTMSRVLDNDDWGPITRHIINVVRKAVVETLEPLKAQANKDIARIYSDHYSKAEMDSMNTRINIPSLEVSLSKFDLLALAQMWGNEGNKKAVVDGQIDGLPKMEIAKVEAAFREHLSENDWKFVQETWDYMNSYWPHASAAIQRRKGISPPKVEGVPFQIKTSDGKTVSLQGGYSPLAYDRRFETKMRGKLEEVDENYGKILSGASATSMTKHGFSIERVGSGGRPVVLSINTWTNHVNEVIKDISMTDAIIYVDKVLKHPKVVGAFKTTGNAEALTTLDLWLKDVAVGEIPAAGAEKVSKFIRSNFALSKIGFNMNTALLQITGLPQTVVVVGKGWFGRGLKDYALNPKKAIRSAIDHSDFMRTRYELDAFNKDIQDIFEAMKNKNHAGTGWVGKLIRVTGAMRVSRGVVVAAFWMMKNAQLQVDTITWWAGYHKGVNLKKLNHSQAVDYANSVVENAQTSGMFNDRAGVERGTINATVRQAEAVKLFTSLGSYMLAKGNIAYESGKKAQGITGAISTATDMMMLFLPELLLYTLIKGAWPDDDENWFWWLAGSTASQVAATVPVVREIPSAIKGFGVGGPLGAVVGDVGRVVTQTKQGELDLPAVKAYVNLFGDLTGAPSAQTNRIIEYVTRTAEGEDTNPIEIVVGKQK